MKNKSIFRRALSAFAVLGLVATTTACDNPVGQDDDHLEARGVVITDMSGTVIAETDGDHWDYANGSDIRLSVGAEMEVRVFFVNPAGNRFQVENQASYRLVVEFTNPAVAAYSAHGDHGDLEALSAGETGAIFHLWHGSHPSGHADYSAPALDIVVEGRAT